jgi:hypothetical protein
VIERRKLVNIGPPDPFDCIPLAFDRDGSEAHSSHDRMARDMSSQS